jgi:OFA family oxalate/formate antiporter-like MFS transporter
MENNIVDNTFKTPHKNKFYYGWIILVACLLLITMTYGIRFSYGVFFTSIEHDFSLNRAITSGIFSVYMLLGCIFAIIGGWLSDRYGPKLVFLTMGFMTCLGLVLTSMTHEFWMLFLTYSLLLSVGTGPTYIISTSVATKWFTKRRGLALAIVTSGVGLGSIWMAPFATYLIADFGWRYSFVIIGIIAFVVIVSCSLVFKRAPSELLNSASKSAYNKTLQSKDSGEFSLKEALKTRNFWVVLSLWFFHGFIFFIVVTHIVPYSTDSGVTAMEAATILSIIGFTSLPSRIVMGIVSDRYGRKRAGLISALFMVLAVILLIQSTGLWTLYLFAVVFGMAYGGLSPSTTAIIGDSFGTRNIGVIMGFIEIGWVTGAAAGPALAGFIFDTTGKYHIAFLFALLAALLIIILFFMLKTKRLPGH